MNLINRIFSSNHNSYSIARSSLSRVKTKLDSITDSFTDVIEPEVTTDSKWSKLPSSIASGVSVLSLELTDKYHSLLTHYLPKGFLAPHQHSDDYELNKVIRGSLSNKITGERFETGDTFVIDKNERHYLTANEETYVYCVRTPDEELLTIPQIKPNVLKTFNQLIPG